MRLAVLLVALAIPAQAHAQFIDVPSAPTCTQCSIQLTPVVRLIAPEAAATAFTLHSKVSRSADGYYYVAPHQSLGVLVFDPTGRYVRTVAVKEGKGPGEVQRDAVAFPRGGDTIEVFDVANRRRSLFRRNGDFIGSRGLIASRDYLPLSDQRLLVSTLDRLHIFDATGAQIRSFALTPTSDRMMSLTGIALARDADAIWTWDRIGFTFERWTLDGKRTAAYKRSPDWFHAPKPEDIALDMVHQVAETADGVWILAGDKVAPPETTQGVPSFREMPKTFDTVLELIDVTNGRKIAGARYDDVVNGFVFDADTTSQRLSFYRFVEVDLDVVIDITDVALRR